ncbi:hypothetical protein EQF93_02565 [Helcococcus ovis]|uniref:hypothetical protein n=1 Tax=Helcococcus ovis TaxID=72026 RepID=UPI00106FD65A|nr:hypothetical protein [Helcococcus ovis]TFF68339.1 hypothetical protein EQF93_02565 [Helcococcus ovis]WNZ00909.1 hypothetical protein EQF90_006485 [Helcococcus ovis]
MKENILRIRKIKNNRVRDGRQVRVSEETYNTIKQLADESNMNIGDIAELIMDWAIGHVRIVD